MKKSTITLSILFTTFLAVSLACNFSVSLGNPTPTPSPTASPTPLPPTNTPIPLPPTSPPVATEALAAPPEGGEPVIPDEPQLGVLNPDASVSGDVYYNDTFENLDNWSYFLLKGDEAGIDFSNFDNRWRTEISAQDTWLYYLFEGGDFSDVQINLEVENRASNTNFVGIICRYGESGWYETNILNTGEYFVYYAKGDASNYQLSTMYKGASRLILTGQKINDYTVICQGDQLSIYINGSHATSIPLRTGDYPFLSGGKVGLSVSTTSVIPVVVDFLQFILSVP